MDFISHSLRLILARASLALSGIIFWWVAVRLYPLQAVGSGSFLICAASLLTFFSSLGAASTFIRFIPEENNQASLVWTLTGFSLSICFIISIVFVSLVYLFFPNANIFGSIFSYLVFCSSTALILLSQLSEGVYISLRHTPSALLLNLIQNFLRILLLFFFTALGGLGIFLSISLAALAAIMISLAYFVRKHHILKFRLRFDLSLLKKLMPFSFVNLLIGLSFSLPGMFFTVVIFLRYSPESTAIFYIPWMIFTVYASSITSVTSVFLMKASYGDRLDTLLRKSLFFSIILGLIGIFVFGFFGDKALLLVKSEFAERSFGMLRILFFSIFFFIINQIYITILNIRKRVFKVGFISCLITAGIFIISAVLMPKFKLEAIAYAWLISNALVSIYILINFKQEKRLLGL